MFVQSKVVYIIKDNSNDPKSIIKDLIEKNIYNYFFQKSDLNNKVFTNFISSLPEKTVFCINENFKAGKNISGKYTNIAIPFLSSHINFPVKVGETVWFYRYNSDSQNNTTEKSYNIDGYYLGRVHSFLNTEDTSYCFSDREKVFFRGEEDDIEDYENSDVGILEIIELENEYFGNTEDAIYSLDILPVTDTSKEILTNQYYKKELENLKLKPSSNLSVNSEDIAFQGTYNTLLSLSSNTIKNKKDINSNTDFTESKSGKIQIISGVKEKYKENSFESSRKVKLINKDNSIDEDGSIISLYKDCNPEINNGLFFETVKSKNQFINNENLSSDIREKLSSKKINDIKENKSSLVISDLSEESVSLKKNISFNIPQILNSFSINENKNKNYITLIPDYTSSNSHNNELLSSISAISDNITISSHRNSSGSVTLINPNGENPSYLSLSEGGNIHINADKIVIGDYSRSSLNSHGVNASLYLGYSSEMQSLVLGEQLEAFLKEILNIQKESLILIKDLFKQSKEIDKFTKDTLDNLLNGINTFGSSLSGTPISAQSASLIQTYTTSISKMSNIKIDAYQTQIDNFKASNEEDLINRLNNIENNLNKILSKFTKTS